MQLLAELVQLQVRRHVSALTTGGARPLLALFLASLTRPRKNQHLASGLIVLIHQHLGHHVTAVLFTEQDDLQEVGSLLILI